MRYDVRMVRKCRKCGKEIPNRVAIEGAVHNISHRRFCVECSPFRSHNTRYALIESQTGKRCRCGETNPDSFSAGRHRMCRKCVAIYGTKRGRDRRRQIRDLMGGKCKYCGYSKYQVALSLHHTDPKKKDPNARGMRSWGWERVLEEIKHCELVCSNCHIAIHAKVLCPVRSSG